MSMCVYANVPLGQLQRVRAPTQRASEPHGCVVRRPAIFLRFQSMRS